MYVFGCTGSSLLGTGFLHLRGAGATLPCGTWASHCSDVSCCGVQAVEHVVVVPGVPGALAHRHNSYGALD